MLWKFGLRKEECELIYFLIFAIRKSGTMDPKILVKYSKIAPNIRFRKKNKKNRPSSFELEKCFLKPHSSKTQIALVTEPDGSRRRSTEAPCSLPDWCGVR